MPFMQNSKNVGLPIPIHSSFYLKLTLEAVKHQQLKFLFTQIMVMAKIID